jgi:hypothetical protein
MAVLYRIFSLVVRQHRHRLKSKHFNGNCLTDISQTSPVLNMTDDESGDLLKHWSHQKNLVGFVNHLGTRSYYGFLFTHVSHKPPFVGHRCNEQDKPC